ncbi:hypothetical protein TNCV_5044761 [Trichonephila clavipes]|uniref:Uncharacterized protein n=1 Tax=Trichonephila clavipes TaxID=2585209 RepID=A0A8X7BKB3_TRICX|nr:hypothetical protein TNCV_5044761 [Trichonephila clavipes]
MERGEEDQIWSSINHIKNLTPLTSSKYNELNEQVTLDEDRTTKKFSISNQLTHKERAGWIDGLEKDLLVLRTKNWKTLAIKRMEWKRLLEKAEVHLGLSSH